MDPIANMKTNHMYNVIFQARLGRIKSKKASSGLVKLFVERVVAIEVFGA